MNLKEELRQANKAQKVRLLFDFMTQYGNEHYEEDVTQMEHALQSAYLAKTADQSHDLIAAALFHDIGHMLADAAEGHINPTLKDDRHETLAAAFFTDLFPPSVIEPIRLHVEAKRFLCTTQQDYYEGLSMASQKSFHLQGGPMNEEELAGFKQNTFYKEAVQLRIWDDEAKLVGKAIPGLETYQKSIEEALL